jgi:YqaJ-like recombinase protein
MAIYHKSFGQRSAEWYRIRAGIPTASCFHKIVTPTGRASGQAEKYQNYLLAEFMLGRPLDDEFQSQWMQRGEELEASAIRAYEFHRDCQTEECAFVTTDNGLIGCSPDRLVGDDGIVEMKVPSPQVHIASLLNQDMSDDHRCQIQGQLWVTERDLCDIVSFHPEMPPVIIRAERNEAYIKTLSAGVQTFVDIMLQRRFELEQRFGPFSRPEPKRKEAVEDWLGVSMDDVDAIIAARAAR